MITGVSGVRPRLIPVLLIRDNAVFTTRTFQRPSYVGDLLNTVRIFNELEVDELIVLDVDASREGRGPNLELLRAVADECFMPLCYGGGVSTVEQMHALYNTGIEKVSLNRALYKDPGLLERAAARFGRQAVVASLDAVLEPAAQRANDPDAAPTRWTAREFLPGMDDAPALARRYAELGAGELLIGAVLRDGSRQGYDLELFSTVCTSVAVPVIAHCGADGLSDVQAVLSAGAAAAAASTMLMRQKAFGSVLVHYPNQRQRSVSMAPPPSWVQP